MSRRKPTGLVVAVTAVIAVTSWSLPTARAVLPDTGTGDGVVPYQYIAKVFSEALGRTPQQDEWADGVAFFEARGCSGESLRDYGTDAFASDEFIGLPYGNEARLLAAYRTVLNREPDPAGYALALGRLDAKTSAFADEVATLFASPEFETVAPQACNPATPDYNFGTTPAIDVPVDGEGFVGDQVALQYELDSAAPGTTVYLAPRTVVRLLSPLDIPHGVELATTGRPGPRQYADMARLVRAPVWPTFRESAVILKPGARLDGVWVDGQAGSPARHDAPAMNVRVESGTGTTVTRSRLGNSMGATSISSFGDHGFDPCVDNEFTYNFIEAYASDHFGGTWSDGISIGCEDALVAYNEVVDTTDVSIITFAQPNIAQVSEVRDNVVLNAGQGAFAPLGISPWIDPVRGDGPNEARMNFTGSVFKDNVFWNSPRSVNESGILVGVRAASGPYSYNGFGQLVIDNTTGTQKLWAQNGIIVSGMLDTTVLRNTIDLVLVGDASTCPPAAVGAWVSGGHASGQIQGPYLDAAYSACIQGPTGLM